MDCERRLSGWVLAEGTGPPCDPTAVATKLLGRTAPPTGPPGPCMGW